MRPVPETRSPLHVLNEEIVACRKCPRLVRYREKVAREKRRAYREWTYWGRPVPGFGDGHAALLILGLAPAAHGANRTGRMFTGDRSGDFLYAGLYRAGFANQPSSTHRDDGLVLSGAFITAPLRCAPPLNMPAPDELRRCAPFLRRELSLLPIKVVLALGAIAFRAVCDFYALPRPRPKFAHGAQVPLPGGAVLLGCYHVS